MLQSIFLIYANQRFDNRMLTLNLPDIDVKAMCCVVGSFRSSVLRSCVNQNHKHHHHRRLHLAIFTILYWLIKFLRTLDKLRPDTLSTLHHSRWCINCDLLFLCTSNMSKSARDRSTFYIENNAYSIASKSSDVWGATFGGMFFFVVCWFCICATINTTPATTMCTTVRMVKLVRFNKNDFIYRSWMCLEKSERDDMVDTKLDMFSSVDKCLGQIVAQLMVERKTRQLSII